MTEVAETKTDSTKVSTTGPRKATTVCLRTTKLSSANFSSKVSNNFSEKYLFIDGQCRNGDNCSFAHGDHELRTDVKKNQDNQMLGQQDFMKHNQFSMGQNMNGMQQMGQFHGMMMPQQMFSGMYPDPNM